MKSVVEEEWINKIIELLKLDERSIYDRLLRRAKYDYLTVFGGILLHINGQGVVWLPKSYIEGLLSKAGLSSLAKNKVGLLFSFGIPGGGIFSLAYDFLKHRVWKEPPSEPRQYLPRLTDRVEYGSFTVTPYKTYVVTRSIKPILELVKKKKTGEEAPFHIHFLRLIDKIAITKENQKGTTLTTLAHQVAKRFQRIPTFKCRDEHRVLKFIDGLEKDGFRVIKVSQPKQKDRPDNSSNT